MGNASTGGGVRGVAAEKLQNKFPVGGGHIMLPGAQVVADPVAEKGFFRFRKRCRAQSARSEKPVDAFHGPRRTEFVEGIRPDVLRGARHQKRTGRRQRQKPVLIERKTVLMARIGIQHVRKPPGEGAGDERKIFRFRVPVAREGGSAAAGIVADNSGKTRIVGKSPERGFPETGMSVRPDLPRINFRSGLRKIEEETVSPRPCADRGQLPMGARQLRCLYAGYGSVGP